MKHRTILLSLVTLLLSLVSLPAATTYLSVDEVKPGMSGVGVTVFEGIEREEFKVHIIGVLQNVMGPKRSLILAKLEGGPLKETGVIAGMSGSPVYIDGKLIGAVSYSLGAFSKEPIAGITPIAEMTEAVSLPARRPALPAEVRRQVLPNGEFQAVLRESFARVSSFADQPRDVQSFGMPAAAGSQLATMLRPIATPLVMGGFTAEVRDILASTLRDQGFLPMVGGASAGAPQAFDEPLQPGDAIGVSLVRGDLDFAATGTVTHVDGERVYAFGHPFYNLGPTQFPMTRAYIHTLLPSLFSSSKISGVGDVIGTIQQDRATAIAGTLGDGPPLVPVSLALENSRGLQKTFKFEIANDQMFTPLLTYVAILNTLRSYEREFGTASFTVKGKATIKDHGQIAYENIFTGDSPSIGAASSIAAPLMFLLGNDLAPVEIEGIDITISTAEQPQTATLERVWLDEIRIRPGRTVALKLLSRTYGGEEMIRTVPIDIPANATGTLSILVSDGQSLAQWEQRELRQRPEPQNIGQIMRALNNTRKNNRLYVRLLSSDAGAVVNGETLSALPPSVLSVFEAERNGGSFIPLRSAAVGEWEVALDHALSGSRLLTIDVSRD